MISENLKEQLSKLEPGDEFPDGVDMKLMAVNWVTPDGDQRVILGFSRDGSIEMTSSEGEKLVLLPPENWTPITKIPYISDISAINSILFTHLVDKFVEMVIALIFIRSTVTKIEDMLQRQMEHD